MISWQNRRRLASLCLLAMASAPWAWFGVCKVRRRVIENQIGTLATVETTLRTEVANERGADEATPAPAPGVERPRWTLPAGPEIAATMQELERAAATAGVVVSTVRTPASAEGRQPFELIGTGRPEQLCTWLAAIEQHNRLMLIESAKIVQHDDSQIGFEVTVATHFVESGR